MDKDTGETKHARIPVGQTYRKSPFTGLFDHASKMRPCVETMKAAVTAYCEGNYEEFDRLAGMVADIEHEADLIKGNIRAHLPRFIFMPVGKTDFLMLLKEVDSVMDRTEDVVVLMGMRRTPIPDDIKGDFIRYAGLVVETALDLEKLVLNVKDLLETSFVGKERDETKLMVKQVHEKELEADKLEASLTKKVFNMQGDPVSVFHLVRVLDRMDRIADHAENAADRVRAMIAK